MGTQNQSERTDVQTFQITVSERPTYHMQNGRRVLGHLGQYCNQQNIPHG